MSLPSTVNSCFFCCKPLSKEDPPTHFDNPEMFFEFIENNKDINLAVNSVIKEHVLQISQYLNISADLITEQDGNLFGVQSCQDCGEISEKLSKLCEQLEVIKLKINYYVGQLASQIITKSTTSSEKGEPSVRSNLSKFQEIFQDKCLSKLSTTDANPPMVTLNNLETSPSQLEEQLISEEDSDSEDDCQIITPEEDHDNDNLPEAPIYLIDETDNLPDPSDDPIKETDNPTEAPSSKPKFTPFRRTPVRKSIECDLCSKMITFSNMSAHKRKIHGVKSSLKSRTTSTSSTQSWHRLKKQKPCEFCGKLLASRNLSTHQKYYCPVKVHKQKIIMVNVEQPTVRENFVENGWDDGFKCQLKKCELCQQVIKEDRFEEHERLWCPIKMQITDVVNEADVVKIE